VKTHTNRNRANKTERYSEDGGYTKVHKYDEFGQEIVREYISPDGVPLSRYEYTWSDLHELVESRSTDENRNLVLKKYGTDGYEESITSIDSNGKLNNQTLLVHDAQGRVIEKKVCFPDESVKSRTVNSYDTLGRHTHCEMYRGDDSLERRWVKRYHDNNKVKEWMIWNPNGTKETKFFDLSGDLIKPKSKILSIFKKTEPGS